MKRALPLLVLACLLPSPAAAQRLSVVASVFPLYELAREVGGERVNASLLVPPGSEAHHWEPKPSDLARLEKADLFCYLGEFLEKWAPRTAKASGVRASLAAARGLPLRDGDPHLWLDFSLDARLADILAGEFSRLDPPGAAAYRANAESLKQRLLALDRRYREGLAACKGKDLLFAGHAAFGTLAARYGLRQIAVMGPSPDSEPTPRAVAGVITEARNRGIRAVFFEELVNPKLARVIADEAGALALPLFPGHELTAAQWRDGVTFLSLMEQNLVNLRRGLGCE